MGAKLEKIGAELEKARAKRAALDVKIKNLNRSIRKKKIRKSTIWFMQPT